MAMHVSIYLLGKFKWSLKQLSKFKISNCISGILKYRFCIKVIDLLNVCLSWKLPPAKVEVPKCRNVSDFGKSEKFSLEK